MFPITITLHDSAQLNAVMAALALPSEAPEKSQAKPKSATTARSQPTTEAAQSKADPSTAAVSAADAVDYPTLQKAVAKLFAKDAKALDAVNSKLAELEIA
jgi:hypothetical protein